VRYADRRSRRQRPIERRMEHYGVTLRGSGPLVAGIAEAVQTAGGEPQVVPLTKTGWDCDGGYGEQDAKRVPPSR
jgi:hypothetical protein